MSKKDEYRVVWINASGNKEYVVNNQDYCPLTRDEALEFAAGRKRHARHFKDTNLRVEVRRITERDWRKA